jgi:hypothetical protein
MLHLLPDQYIKEIQKEYRQRTYVAACNLLAFCLFIFTLGCIPAYLIVTAQKGEIARQSNALTLKISDEDKAVATAFESSVRRGIAVAKNTSALTSKDVEHILSIPRKGIVLNGVAISNDGTQQAKLQGIADTRTDLSAYIRAIRADGTYGVDDVPASTFTKDKDIAFILTLREVNQPAQ